MNRPTQSKSKSQPESAAAGLSALTRMLVDGGFKPHQIEAVFRKPATVANSAGPADGGETRRSGAGTRPSRAA